MRIAMLSRVPALRAAVLGVLALGLLTGAPQAQTPPARASASANLTPHPAVLMGKLPNGMRYAIRKTANPPGQVALRFAITAGSMQEASDQQGLAHFLEHMAFHGSAKTPDGEVMRTLERLGARMGADTNASTGSDQTVYMFNLPKNDAASIDVGLGFFREIASNLTLDPKLFESERAVVLSELRMRAGAEMDAQKAAMAAQFGDHPYARSPGGLPEVISGAPIGRLKAFYDAYYRPERGILVIAGDIDPVAMEARIKALFSDWMGRGPAGRDPAPAKLPQTPKAVALSYPGVMMTTINFIVPASYRPVENTRAETIRLMQQSIVGAAYGIRMQDLREANPNVFGGASAWRENVVPGVARFSMGQITDPKNPAQAIDLIVKVQKQAEQFGFSAAEIERAISNSRVRMQSSVSTDATIAAPNAAGQILGALTSGRTLISPEHQLELFEEAAKTMTPERSTAVMREMSGKGSPLIIYRGFKPAEGGEVALQAAYDKARSAPVTAYAAKAETPWAHTDFGPAGQVVERRTDPDIDAVMVRFANNTRLTIKHTDFDKDQVFVTVRMGNGVLDWPKDKVGPAYLGDLMFSSGGLTDMTQTELNRLASSKNIMLLLITENDAFEMGNSSGSIIGLPGMKAGDLDFLLQALTAYLVAPGWRTDPWERLLGVGESYESVRTSSASMAFGHMSGRLLKSGDTRGSEPDDREGWTAQAAIDFMKPIVETAPLDIVIVGDIAPDAAIAAVAKTMGAIPARPDKPEPPGLRDVRFPAPNATPTLLTHQGPRDQALVYIAWPANDFFADTRETKAAQLMATILRSRAVDTIRNAEGKTYSPGFGASLSRDFPGYGYISASATVKPEDVDLVYDRLYALAADIAANGVTADELTRARTPMLEGFLRDKQSNPFWLGMLGRYQTRPQRVVAMKRFEPELAAVTAADIQAIARKWLVRDKSYRVTVLPGELPAPLPPTPGLPLPPLPAPFR